MIRGLNFQSYPLTSGEGRGAKGCISHKWPVLYQSCLCNEAITTQEDWVQRASGLVHIEIDAGRVEHLRRSWKFRALSSFLA